MESLGQLSESGDRYEFHYKPMGLVVRGNYAEWVLEAAAEIIAQTERISGEGRLDELVTLAEFGEAEPIELDSAKMDLTERFEKIPQCIVSMGRLDYKWTSPTGREMLDDDAEKNPLRRIHDMSMTRNNSFLKNEDNA